MARSGVLHFHRFPQSKSIDAVRGLSPLSAFDRFVAATVHDPDAASSALEIHSLTLDAANPTQPLLQPRSSWSSPSRISSLRSSQTPHKHLAAAAATLASSLHLLFVDPVDGSIDSELSVAEDCSLHDGPISVVDLQAGGQACVTVGEDGRVNLLTVGKARRGWLISNITPTKGLPTYYAALIVSSLLDLLLRHILMLMTSQAFKCQWDGGVSYHSEYRDSKAIWEMDQDGMEHPPSQVLVCRASHL